MIKRVSAIILGLWLMASNPALARGNSVSCAFDAAEASVKQVIGEGLAADEKARESDAYVGSTNNLGQIAGACAVEYKWSDQKIDAASHYAVARMGREVVASRLSASGVTHKALEAGFATLTEALRTAFADGNPTDADVEAAVNAFMEQGVAMNTEADMIAVVQWITFNTLEAAAIRNFGAQ